MYTNVQMRNTALLYIRRQTQSTIWY